MAEKCLFIFRRDLRLEDNLGLIFAAQNAKKVIPCFIFTPEQIEHNPYRSNHCLQFMIESLEDLSDQLKERGGKLYYFYDQPEEVVGKCIKKLGVDLVVANRDYTPYAQVRDQKIGAVCKKNKVEFHIADDALLNAPEETLKADGEPYTVFTPYFKNASKIEVPLPQKNRASNYFTQSIPFAEKSIVLSQRNPKPFLKGGREAGLKILKQMTHLSPYLKFTVLSPREVYHQLRGHPDLIRSLYWRDFFSHIAFFFPHVFGHAFRKKYDRVKWSYDKKAFHRWCEGKTGFPIVDAGMREMNETGFMSNRVRMITASFLTKDLHIDWRWGEKYFAQQLIDYDPAVNNGNWQWVASTGCDAQPYFRIFNPWTQQKKFDPDCEYIKQWVPELKKASSKEIHSGKATEPMVDHTKESKLAIKLYRSVSS